MLEYLIKLLGLHHHLQLYIEKQCQTSIHFVMYKLHKNVKESI